MTSGNLLNIKIFNEIGPFDERLFIDEVDSEYCLRLNKYNYRLVRHYEIFLIHELGSVYKKKFLWKDIVSTNHTALRRYYITRNRLFVWTKYFVHFPSSSIRVLKITVVEIIKIILIEKNKLEKFYYIILGVIHFIFKNW